MGKRSHGFERRAGDFYETPAVAVGPLLPHLRGVRTFAEPCCGNGALVRHLEAHGLRCVYSGDIATGQDALAVASYGEIDAIITNPPYTRDVMHKMIAHFPQIAPTWLLLEYDWAATKQAAPFMPTCSDIVAVGRLKWIADSKHTGKDNFAWFRFGARHNSGPVFYARDQIGIEISRTRSCSQCGQPYRPQRSDSRFCSNACRQRSFRARLVVTQT
jgi:hypothetical protein